MHEKMLESHLYGTGGTPKVEAQANFLTQASLIFFDLRLNPFSWLEPHYYLIC